MGLLDLLAHLLQGQSRLGALDHLQLAGGNHVPYRIELLELAVPHRDRDLVFLDDTLVGTGDDFFFFQGDTLAEGAGLQCGVPDVVFDLHSRFRWDANAH